ncbi:MAG: DUF2878 family protein [Deltaproteobacteria bacterium]|nr:DUF2878 family protein [Deltaproteobacteria bacterium]
MAERLLGLAARGRVFGLVALISVCSFWRRPILLTAILSVLSCVVLLGRRNRQDSKIFLTCGVLGAIAEVFVVAFGAWSYSAPQVLGIPYWLPLIWGLSALFIRNLEQRLAAKPDSSLSVVG